MSEETVFDNIPLLNTCIVKIIMICLTPNILDDNNMAEYAIWFDHAYGSLTMSQLQISSQITLHIHSHTVLWCKGMPPLLYISSNSIQTVHVQVATATVIH